MKPSKLPTVLTRFLTISASIWATAFLVLCSRSTHGAAPEGLAPSVQADIRALIAEKASWTPIQAKMDSELVHAVKNHRGQAFGGTVSNLRLDVHAQPDGRVLVDIAANVSSGLLAPSGTPRPIIERLNKELRILVAAPDVQERIHAEGGDPLTGSADEYAADIEREGAKWAALIKQLNLKVE